jgi:hypothetical protein
MAQSELDHWRTKIDEKGKKKIYELSDAGYSTALIAKRFCVTWATIFKILKARIAPDARTEPRERQDPPIHPYPVRSPEGKAKRFCFDKSKPYRWPKGVSGNPGRKKRRKV